MVYYLTLLQCACIGIVGTLRTTWRSAIAKEHLHHPRGKRGNEGARRRAVKEAPATGRPVGSGRSAPEDPPDDRSRPDDRCPCTRAKRADVRCHRTTGDRTTGPDRKSATPASDPERADDRSPADVWYLAVSSCGLRPMYPFTYPFVALDYIYSSTSTI